MKNITENGDHIKIAKNAGISTIGISFSYVLRYISALILTNFLGAGVYGVYILSLSIVEISKVFSVLGLNYGLIRYIPLFRSKNEPGKVRRILEFTGKFSFALGVSFAVLLFLLANVIAEMVFKEPSIVNALRILSFALPFMVVMFILTSSFKGFQTLKYQVYVEHIFTPSFRLVLFVIAVLFGLNLYGVLGAVIVSSAFGCILAYYYIHKNFRTEIHSDVQADVDKKKIISYSFPLFIAVFLNIFIARTDILMLGYFMESNEVGIYAIVQRLSHLVLFVSTSFIGIFAPMISELHGLNDLERLRNLYKTVVRWTFTLSLPILLILLIFSDELLALFGEEFKRGYLSLYLLAISALFTAVFGLSGQILTMTGRQNIVLVNSFTAALANVLLNLWLIPIYGFVGAALATAVSMIAINFTRFIEVYYLERLHFFSVKMLKPTAIGLITFIIVSYLRNSFLQVENLPTLLLFCGLLAAIYFGILLLVSLEEEDRKLFRIVRNKLLNFAS